jgi:uncharacterized protein with PQ loop repeat
MAVVTTAGQFMFGCLALGLGMFLMAGAIRDLIQIRLSYRAQVLPAISARAATALGGALLLALGGYAARMTVPL